MEEREVVVGEEKESYSRWGESCRRRGESCRRSQLLDYILGWHSKGLEGSLPNTTFLGLKIPNSEPCRANSRSFPKAYFILGHPVEGEEKVAGNKIFIGG